MNHSTATTSSSRSNKYMAFDSCHSEKFSNSLETVFMNSIYFGSSWITLKNKISIKAPLLWTMMSLIFDEISIFIIIFTLFSI